MSFVISHVDEVLFKGIVPLLLECHFLQRWDEVGGYVDGGCCASGFFHPVNIANITGKHKNKIQLEQSFFFILRISYPESQEKNQMLPK